MLSYSKNSCSLFVRYRAPLVRLNMGSSRSSAGSYGIRRDCLALLNISCMTIRSFLHGMRISPACPFKIRWRCTSFTSLSFMEPMAGLIYPLNFSSYIPKGFLGQPFWVLIGRFPLLIPCSHSHRPANGFFPTFGCCQLFPPAWSWPQALFSLLPRTFFPLYRAVFLIYSPIDNASHSDKIEGQIANHSFCPLPCPVLVAPGGDFFIKFLYIFCCMLGNCRFPCFLPVLAGRFLAMAPPCCATFLLGSSPCGLVALEISVVDTSASILRTNSVFVILSRRLSFFSPLYALYSPVSFQPMLLLIRW